MSHDLESQTQFARLNNAKPECWRKDFMVAPYKLNGHIY